MALKPWSSEPDEQKRIAEEVRRPHLYTYSPTSLESQSPTHPLKWTEIFDKTPLTMGVVRALDLTIVKGPDLP
jgi:hypothetical protein